MIPARARPVRRYPHRVDMRRLLPLVLAAVASAGCVSKPTVKLHHAEISGVQLGFPPQLSVVLTVVMAVTNPNSYDVAVRQVRGQTVIADRFVLPVEYRAEGAGVWLPAGQTTPVRVPVVVPAQTGIAILAAGLQMPSIPFRFTGKADVTATRTLQVEKDNYEVDEKGEIPRAQLDAAVRSVVPFGWLPRRDSHCLLPVACSLSPAPSHPRFAAARNTSSSARFSVVSIPSSWSPRTTITGAPSSPTSRGIASSSGSSGDAVVNALCIASPTRVWIPRSASARTTSLRVSTPTRRPSSTTGKSCCARARMWSTALASDSVELIVR